MTFDYLEFDVDVAGKGVMYITFNQLGMHYYLGIHIFNKNGLRFKRNTCDVIGCIDADGEDVDVLDINAIELLDNFLSQNGVLASLKTKYWHEIRNTNRT